jgi:hypothetical protein
VLASAIIQLSRSPHFIMDDIDLEATHPRRSTTLALTTSGTTTPDSMYDQEESDPQQPHTILSPAPPMSPSPYRPGLRVNTIAAVPRSTGNPLAFMGPEEETTAVLAMASGIPPSPRSGEAVRRFSCEAAGILGSPAMSASSEPADSDDDFGSIELDYNGVAF